jgi:uncharacterized heparinase superfamily protein
MSRPALYWHTLRYLRPRQIGNRIWRRIHVPRVDMRSAPALRSPDGPWCVPAARKPSMVGPMVFRFLSEERRIDSGKWMDVEASALWCYNLHYFDDLNAEKAAERTSWHRVAIDDWVRMVPPGSTIAWDAYPTSLRLVNWVKWFLAGSPAEPGWIHSLAIQARAIEQRLEYHLGGNHLLSNAKALVFAGAFFDGAEAARWMRRGLEILRKEIGKQILSDGGHYERSPMYHALAFEDLLDLINVTNARRSAVPADFASFVATWPAIARRMGWWMRSLCHPDGQIAFFNDAAFDIGPSPSELLRYAFALRVHCPTPSDGLNELRPSGYFRITSADAVAIIDAGLIGPDDLPGHAHADTLSFELSLFGQRVFVNGGTSTYEPGWRRDMERGTSAHNTVVVDDENSSEVWAAFRVARRARPHDVRARLEGSDIHVCASHDGYYRLSGRPEHCRSWRLAAHRFVIEDEIRGGFQSAVARFHLQPGIQCQLADTGCSGFLELPNGRRIHWGSNMGARLESSTYAPRFGVVQETLCIAVPADNQGQIRMELNW